MNPVIEAFRGAAALLVVIHHYSYHLGADPDGRLTWLHFFHNGVDLFFVLTGYLFAPYVLGATRIGLRAFAVRRAFRLYPLYLLSLASGAATLWADPQLVPQLARHLVFVQTLPVFAPAEAGYFSLVYWTLPVEVGFYLLVALAMALVRQHSDGIWLLAWWGLLAVAGVVLSASGHEPGSERWIQQQAQLPALLLEFWIGMALYRAMPLLQRSRHSGLALLVAAVGLLALLMAWYPLLAQGTRAPRPFGAFNMLSALAYALLLGAALAWPRRGQVRRAETVTRIALLAGSLSYGVYLFHGFAMGWVEAAGPGLPPLLKICASTLLTLVVAAVLHSTVEGPARSLGRRWGSCARPAPA